MPSTSPTAWAYLNSGDCTIRWQRGDKVAYVFEGKQLKTYPDQALKVGVLDTIPSPKGWMDMAHVRRVGTVRVSDIRSARSSSVSSTGGE